jgi:adenylate cyclase
VADQRVQRRLAAIVAADVVDYSRLMGEDEAGTRARFNDQLGKIVQPAIDEHRGRLVKTMGDGFLIEFGSVVDAVQCAAEIQNGVALRQNSEPDARKMLFRIGVHLGDVIVEGEDIHGDGVNVAARLEALADPGGICISADIHRQCRGKIDIGFADLGEREFKNIAEPVHAFAIHLEHRPAPAFEERSGGSLPLPDKPSIAVLPFDNISGDPEQEYFSDGITEDIITEMSKISGLFVIARHSAFTFKGKPVILKRVGRELGVRYVLEGSVRKSGNRLRITAQLIDTTTDLHLWAERYDRDLEDVFAVQAEVARSVATALVVALKPAEGERLEHPSVDNIEAYDLYLRTRATPWPPTRENLLSARYAYERIIETDPTFVGGHAGKALTHGLSVIFGSSGQPEKDAEIAVSTAKKALELDESFAHAHSALGLGYLASGEHDQAVILAQKATELQPSDPDAHMFLGIALLFAGKGDEACETAETALRIDPQFTKGPYLNLLGNACCAAGRYGEAIEAFKRNVAQGGPMGAPMLHSWVAALVAEGRLDEARATANELLKFFPEFSLKRYGMLHMHKNKEDSQRLIGYLREAGLPE